MDEALRELARREKARRDLLYFCQYTFAGYQRTEHLRLLADRLEAVERSEIKRLMVFMPPRHGKSEMVSVRFPAWYLGRNPDRRVILTSYAGNLAQGFSRRVRNLINSGEYETVFGEKSALDEPVLLSQDSRAAHDWNLDPHRGGMVAAGVGGGITGKGADLLIIDDPVKDRAEAESQAVRDATDAWYGSTAYTRLEDGAAVILMMTRWHRDDLAGRLLRRMADDPSADQWHLLVLPAFSEKDDELEREAGAALWPEKYDAETLTAIRANIGSYDFEALYQQRPRSAEGGIFKRGWFEVVEHAPEGLRWARYWDLAVSVKATADYTASARAAMDDEGYLYIADMIRGRWEWPDARRRIISVAVMEPGVAVGIESVAFQLAAVQDLRRERAMAARELQEVRPDKDKVSRALAWASRAEAGKVRLVRGPWIPAFLDEVCDFPVGARDDQVDTVSGDVQMLARRRGVSTGRVDFYD